jgi:tRNA (uracil-5-)-methyltransferase TRM9
MNRTLIQKLNQLNQQFYQTTAVAFDQTRQAPWAGWLQLRLDLAALVKNKPNVRGLDLGCGNGRWQKFLFAEFPKTSWQLTGLDSNSALLAKAAVGQEQVNWQKFDVVQAWLQTNGELNTLTEPALTQTYDLITVFGVLHHLPSLKLRTDWLKYLASKLNPGGLLIYTHWQFDQEAARFEAKTLDPSANGFNPAELEYGDKILNWLSGTNSLRYCHLVDAAEAKNIGKELRQAQPSLQLHKTFQADGKSGQLNRYYVWQQT